MGELALAAKCTHVPAMPMSEQAALLAMLPEYAQFCCGEGAMHDTAMLYGALGWDSYTAHCEVVTEYFPSSGTGQTNVIFPAH